MYNIGVTVYCPAGINTEGFKEENKTKPKETVEIEGGSSTLSSDQCADILINGLKKVKINEVLRY
jgi:3-dehydrosphinganine reductase